MSEGEEERRMSNEEEGGRGEGEEGEEEEEEDGEVEEEHLFRIIIATDNHLGYLEKDPIRGNDSFVTFEEILQEARKHQADFVLLGGDLFHDNKPSRSCMYKTMELIRRYTFGPGEIKFSIVSDPAKSFHTNFGVVNYEDPNYNIDLPIFSIHGNHDDPAGDGGLAALDLLSVSNFVNYFGKSDNIDEIKLSPILFQKGETKLAVYGLGNIRDERLYRTFQQKKVTLLRPTEDREDWFNLLVLHQNRVAHNPKNYVREEMLDSFLHFIVWGHEHECRIHPESSSTAEFKITQPGSSVATSLSQGESEPKYIGLLEIYKSSFKLKPIPLTTVRPFIIRDVVLASQTDLTPEDPAGVQNFLVQTVEKLIQEANETSISPTPLLPLIRLRVDYTGFSTVNPARFGQKFVGKVANPNEILLYTRKRPTTKPKTQGETVYHADDLDLDLADGDLKPQPMEETSVEDLVRKYFRQMSTKLEILPEEELNIAIHNFVEKDDKQAIAEFVNSALSKTQKILRSEDLKSPDDVPVLLAKHQIGMKYEESSSSSVAMDLGDEPVKPKRARSSSKNDDSLIVNDSDDFMDDRFGEEEEEEEFTRRVTKAKAKSKAKSKAKAKTAATSPSEPSARKKRTSAEAIFSSPSKSRYSDVFANEDEEEEEQQPATRKRKSKTSPASAPKPKSSPSGAPIQRSPTSAQSPPAVKPVVFSDNSGTPSQPNPATTAKARSWGERKTNK